MRRPRFLHRALVRLRREERGFGLVETMVALGVIFVSLLALAFTATVAFTDIAFARQRQTANQIGNQLMEEVRGLAYAAVQRGLSDSDISGDPNIVSCAGEFYFQACPPGGEPIVHSADLPPTPPLVPHQGSFGPPDYPTTFDWSVYVTRAADAPEAGAFRVTAVVSWAAPQRRGVANFVEVQTLLYSPQGCVDTATHPFAAPCQPFFYGTGEVAPGTILTAGTVEGLTFESFSVDLLEQHADAQIEQVIRVDGGITLPGGTLDMGSDVTMAGRSGAASAADSDPASAIPEYDQQSAGPQPGGTLSLSGLGNELKIRVDGSESGSTTSTTSAGGSNQCTTQGDGLPCGYASATPSGVIEEVLSLSNTEPGSVGDATLVWVGPLAAPNTAYVRRIVAVPGTDGALRETVHRELPDVLIGGLPSAMDGPPGWDDYWIGLTGYAVTVQAEAGTDTGAPSVTIEGGTLWAWNPSPGCESVPKGCYTPTDVTVAGGPITVASLPLFCEDTGGGNTVCVDISGTVSVEPSSTAETLAAGSSTTRTEAIARAGSPLVATITYEVRRNGELKASLILTVGLGQALAQAAYQPAPTP